MTEIIPLSAVPNQTFACPVGSQNCRLNVYQKSSGLYIDVIKDDQAIILGVICEDRNRIIRNVYLGFSGDFAFFDTQKPADAVAGQDPEYTGLGTRYQLIYIPEDELDGGDV
jgi:hypothetical protein